MYTYIVFSFLSSAIDCAYQELQILSFSPRKTSKMPMDNTIAETNRGKGYGKQDY